MAIVNCSAAVYAEVKAAIKAEMESKGKKYPTNTNGLSEEFIVAAELFCLKIAGQFCL